MHTLEAVPAYQMAEISRFRLMATLGRAARGVLRAHGIVKVRQRGRGPRVAVIRLDDLEAMQETLSIITDGEAAADLREGIAAVREGDLATLDDLRSAIERSRAKDQ